jgi:hypothetical protein
MRLVLRSEKRAAISREVEKLIGSNSIIGVRANGILLRVNEKSFIGVSGTFLFGKGHTIEKMLFLFGSHAASTVSYKGGKMEVCIS